VEHIETIKSDHGTDHTYTVILHPAEEGYVIGQKLLKIIAAIAPPIIDGVMGSKDGSASGGLGEVDLDAQVHVSGEAVGRAISMVAAEIAASGGVGFVKDILKYTTRTNAEGNPGRVVEQFNLIYQGNYGEMAKAVACALKANFGPSLRASLGAVNTTPLGGFLNKLQG